MTVPDLRYLLITPAKNEATFIELTIQSVLSQTLRPVRWIIIDDGSTDRTAEIVDRHAQKHDWIELLQMPERQNRDFASKADCVNTAYNYTKHLDHDIVASLDADISFEEDYFAFLLQKFLEDPQLGLAGTPFSENGTTYDYRFSSTHRVSGACQLFRRECFEAIGGYTPVKGGGIDVIAVLGARMRGWRTQTFTGKTSSHHRLMGSAKEHRKVLLGFSAGQKDYRLGFHPVWAGFRSVYQMTRKPYIVGGAAMLTGYSWAMFCRSERSVNDELLKFQRKDQMRRLRSFFGLRDTDSVGDTAAMEFKSSTAPVSKT
jgi:cellulose synthase/poly-beta-1,6-N-acetylglucosamine synthase-like glycosyltransferase